MKVGLVARITFRGRPRAALLAHKDALMRTDGKPKVFVIGEDQKARPVEVIEGLANGSYVEVRGAVKRGDLVATEGVERLRPFAAVQIAEAPAVAQQPPASSPASEAPENVAPAAADPSVVERKPAAETEPKTSGG